MNRRIIFFIKIVKYSCKILKTRTVAVVAPYFNEERLKDGYFKRVKAVDDILHRYFRVYITHENYSSNIQFEEYGEDTLVFRYCYSSLRQKLIAAWFLFLCGVAYCHSIWQVKKFFYRIPFLKVIVDVHGVVPEEETLYGRYDDAQIYGDVEEVAVQKSYCLVGVTNSIITHLKKKYEMLFKAKYIILPIFDKSLAQYDSEFLTNKPLVKDKFLTIYAGGIMKWQKIELMQDSIHQIGNNMEFFVATPKPEEFWKTWKYPKPKNLKVQSKSYKDLCEDVYKYAHYGYVLRDDIVVNNVACPTKIAEYLKYGIIPVLNTPNIGDFREWGMKYISLEDMNKKRFFSKKKMLSVVEHNFRVLEKYINVHETGVDNLLKILDKIV